MTHLESRLRLAVYRHFRDTGTAPALESMADELDTSRESISKAALRLHDYHALVLAPDRSESRPRLGVWMAHPFSGVETRYTVETAGRRYAVPCAWDALSLPPLLETDGVCRSECPTSGAELTLEVREGQLVDHGGVIHLAVPAREFWEDIGFT